MWAQKITTIWLLPAILAAAGALLACSKPEYPCTVYRTADFEQARRNIARFPWAKEIYEETKSKAGRYLAMDSEKIRSFISSQTPLAAIKCPVCGKAPWSWYTLLEEGSILECTDCRTRWAWDPTDTSETWNIPAVFRYYRLQYILDGLTAAALVYQIEGDRRYSAKAAVIVRRFAEVFKGYRVSMIHKNQWLDHNDPYYAKIAGWKLREMAVLRDVLLAYDWIHESGDLSPADIQAIDRDLVLYTRDYLLDGYGPGGPSSPASLQDQGPSWWVLAACGALLEDDSTLKLMAGAFASILDPANGMFYEDGGFFQGSPDYQRQFLGPISTIPEILQGHIGADFYGDPRFRLLDDCFTWTLDFLYPDGTIPPVNDSHVGSRPALNFARISALRFGNAKAARYVRDRERRGDERRGLDDLFSGEALPEAPDASYAVENTHFTGSGLMVLRHGGDSASRTMAFLDYGAYEPPNKPPYHKHQDYLNFCLWALGMEMVSEMGYAMTPPWVQRWQVSPLAHNTVLEAALQKEGGRPLIWHPTSGPKMAEAGLPPANSRFIALIPRAANEPIVVDIFRAAGDAPEFTWTMHGRSANLALSGLGTMPDCAVPEPLINGRKGDISGGAFEALWRFTGDNERGLKVLMPALSPRTVMASECPAEEDRIKLAFLKGGTPKPGTEIPRNGHLQVRTQGPEALFVAVYFPFQGQTGPDPTVVCRRLEAGAVGLNIAVGEEKFVLVHNPGTSSVEFEGLRLDGRAGLASFLQNRLTSVSLAEGRSAEFEKTGVFRSTVGNGYRDLAFD